MLLVDELREAWHAEPRGHRVALIVIVGVATALRAMYLAQPIRYDEAVTYLYFVRRPWAEALSVYTYPNNHLFHTLLAKASVTVLGNAPWALRLPAFVAGLLVVLATYPVVRAMYGSRSALLATAVVASSGVLTLYSTNARGYTLLVLAFLALMLLAIRVLRGATPQWAAFGVIAALGLWTVPVMLFPLGSVCLWIIVSLLAEKRGHELRGLGVALGIAAVLTGLFYSPVILREGLAAITRNKFVVSSGWFEFFERLPSTIGEAFSSWSLGVHPILRWTLVVFAAVALWHHSQLARFRVNFLVAAYAWCAWLLVVNHRAPFARVWLWAVPVVAALAAAGFVRLLSDRGDSSNVLDRRIPVLAVALAVFAGASVMLTRGVLLSRDTGTYRDAPQASVVLSRALQPGDRVVAAIPSSVPLLYYLNKLGVSERYFALEERAAKRVVVVFNRDEDASLDAVIARSDVTDQAQFSPPAVLARLPNSVIMVFQRRDATSK